MEAEIKNKNHLPNACRSPLPNAKKSLEEKNTSNCPPAPVSSLQSPASSLSVSRSLGLLPILSLAVGPIHINGFPTFQAKTSSQPHW